MNSPQPELLTGLLKDVSRSFYLTLRVLPARIRTQVGTAYLLARTTDTVADTDLVPLAQRLAALDLLRQSILQSRAGVPPAPSPSLALADFASRQPSSAERLLLEHSEASLALLANLSPADLKLVQDLLQTITSGQQLDLRRFAGASARNIVALSTDEELDDYTYRVAGCVGEFWTKICRAHLFPDAALDDSAMLADGVRFGKGLQLVNILRDLPADLRQGRCYMPAAVLSSARLKPQDLLTPEADPLFRPLYRQYLDRAEDHLRAAWIYTNALPRGQVRLRLACLWPLSIGLDTINLLGSTNVLGSAHPIKVPRRAVKSLMLRSVLYYPFPPLWRKLGPA